MKSIQNALLAYSAGKFILAIGTVVVLFNVATGLVPTWPPIAQVCVGFFIIAILLPMLDGSWDYIEDALRSKNGQAPPMQRSTLHLFFALGTLGIGGSIFLSILSAPMISDVVVDDKSEVAAEMEGAKAQGDAAYLQLLASAERNVRRAEKQLQTAQDNEGKAEKQAVAAIGGEFARLWMSGNAWVRTAPETSASRRRITKAIQAAQAKTADAQNALAQAQAAYNDVTTTGRAESSTATAAVVQAHTVVLNKWLDDLRTTTGFFFRIDIAAGVFCILLLFLLYKAKAIPDDRTLMEVFTKAIRLTADAFVYALGVSVDAAERQAKNAGFVAHPNTATVSQQLQQAQQAQPVATAQQSATTAQQPTATKPQPQHGATNGKPQQSATAKQRATIQSAIRMCRSRMAKAEADFVANAIDEERKNLILAAQQTAIAAHRERLENLEA